MRDIVSVLFKSTASGYALLFLRLAVGLWLTRVLFLNLSSEAYGFWVLMWSVFGYALLLDLGFGVAVQKYASQATADGDWDTFNRRFSTVFFIHCAMGLLIAALTLASLPLLAKVLHLDPQSSSSVAQYRDAFLIFGLGRAMLFPLGSFLEILGGLQKVHIRNLIGVGSVLVSGLVLAMLVRRNAGLESMALALLAIELLGALATVVFIRRNIPALRLSWRLFESRLAGGVLSFSLYAYVVTFANLIIVRTDQVVIGAFLSVSLIAAYHVVWRLANIFQQLATQLLEGLGPVAAFLFETNEEGVLRRTLLQSGRVVGATATAMFVPLAIYLDVLLRIWVDVESGSAHASGLLLLSAAYLAVVFKAVTTRVLLMCEHQKTLALVSGVEAIMNAAISIGLCLFTDFGVVGVALGTVIPAAVLAFAVYIPLACRFADVPVFSYVRLTLAGALVSGAASAAVHGACRTVLAPTSLGALFLGCVPGIAVFVGMFVVVGLTSAERRGLTAMALSARRA